MDTKQPADLRETVYRQYVERLKNMVDHIITTYDIQLEVRNRVSTVITRHVDDLMGVQRDRTDKIISIDLFGKGMLTDQLTEIAKAEVTAILARYRAKQEKAEAGGALAQTRTFEEDLKRRYESVFNRTLSDEIAKLARQRAEEYAKNVVKSFGE